MKNDLVTVTVYGTVQVLTRERAKQIYLNCIACSEGSERERYMDIYLGLLEGYTYINQDKDIYR